MFIINFRHWRELDKSFLMRQQQRAGGAVMRCYKPVMRLVLLEGFNLSLWASFHESVNEQLPNVKRSLWGYYGAPRSRLIVAVKRISHCWIE